MIIRS